MGTRPWAGLDIGTHSVKLVALQPGSTRGRYAEAAIPRALSGDEPPAPAILAGLIDDCMTRIQESPRSFRGISIGVSGPDVIVKQLTLPLMDEAEIAGALRFEARKHLPYDVATLVLDHQVLVRSPAERRLDVLLATVAQQRLDRALAPLRELGIEADIVDAAPLALSNSLSQSLPKDLSADEGHVLLDLGHRGSWLTLRHKGLPYFSRRLDWGGQALTQAIAAATAGSLERADAWKLDAGASLAQDGPESLAARDAVAALGEEVRRSLAFYGTLAPLPGALVLHVSGGTARLAGLTERLGEVLGVSARTFSPLDSHDRGVRIQAGGPQYAQAHGLALRAA
ncbi:MAG: pilus assembly protein PilM [Candidatus Eisenbacteria bacterium]